MIFLLIVGILPSCLIVGNSQFKGSQINNLHGFCVTFRMDLEKMNMGSQDGGWGSERKAHPDKGNDRYQVAEVTAFRIYQRRSRI